MELKFVADGNVGRLAKWLRIMGYDTVFAHPVDDDELIDIARRENRIVLTRDTGVARRRMASRGKLRVILIKSEELQDQLKQVMQFLEQDDQPDHFSRCIECNVPLVPKSKEEVQGLVPPYVFKTQNNYMQCPRCGRIFWRGTHWTRMDAELHTLKEESDRERTGS